MAFEILTQWENMIQLHKIKDFQFKTYAIFTHTFHCSTIMKLKALKTSPTTTFNCFFLEYYMEFSKNSPTSLVNIVQSQKPFLDHVNHNLGVGPW
jgi:hypothetical protein